MTLALLWQVAWRNVWRQRRRNITLILAIGICVGSLIIANGLLRGMAGDIQRDAVLMLTGHWKLQPAAWRDDPGIKHVFIPGSELATDLRTEGVQVWTTRLNVPGVVQSERQSRGVELIGVDPDREWQLSFIADAELEGRWLTGPADPGLVIGTDLAKQLDTQLGRRVVVMTEHGEGGTAEWGGELVGVYSAPGAAGQARLVLTGREALQRRLGVGGITEVSVMIAGDPTPPVDSLRRQVARDSLLETRDWKQLQPMAAAFSSLSGTMTAMFAAVFVSALAFGILNTLITAVLERTRELGLLQCLGMRPRLIVLQVMLESVVIVGSGLLCGLAMALAAWLPLRDGLDLSAFSEGMQMMGGRGRMVPVIESADVVMVCALVIVLGAIGTFYPARKAVRMDPLQAMRGR